MGRFIISGNDASGNSAGVYGGFACLASGEVTSTNNAIGGGDAGNTGAAWFVPGGRFRAYNDTVVSHQSGLDALFAYPQADAELGNCILWNEGMADVGGFDVGLVQRYPRH